MAPSSTSPHILEIGVPWNHSSLKPGSVMNPDKVRVMLVQGEKMILDAGYVNYKHIDVSPEDPSSFEATLREIHNPKWDGVIVGNGIRGNPDMTPSFEKIVNAIKELAPQAKIMFNTTPVTSLDAIQRQFPLPA
jgi:hypothetical protein